MTLVEQGFIIMLLGMAVVFLLLLVLVGSMMLMPKVLKYISIFLPETVEESTSPVRVSSDEEMVAVAIAAIMHKGYALHTR